jgi:epoxyqueuosine reductase
MILAELVQNVIQDEVRGWKESNLFRDPIVGFADAEDPLYDKLDEIIGVPQLHPKKLLPCAKTVIVYFVPFSLEVIQKIQGQHVIVQEWSDCYTSGNLLLARISETLQLVLQEQGFSVKTEPPTNMYDPVALTAKWAHKSSAVIAGIGTFGLNHLLITKSGTAGRISSLITDAKISSTPRPATPYCLYYKTGKCKVCLEKCPTGALSIDGFDRFRCNAYLDGKNIHDLQQGCGMCSSGPCASKGFWDQEEGK